MNRKTMESILHRLKGHFDPYLKTRLSDWRSLASYIVIEQIESRTIIKPPGEKEKFVRFILDGAAAMLVIKNSREVCFDLCFENDFLSDFESINNNRGSEVFIRTFEPVFAVVIDHARLIKIIRASSLAFKLGMILSEQQFQRRRETLTDQLGTTTEDRYMKLLRSRPKVLLRTPQHYVASYLGASTQSLSRIRKKITGRSL